MSEYAPYAGFANASNTQGVSALRAEEDRQFARELCSESGPEAGKLEWLDLAWQDAPVRWQIPTEDVLITETVRPHEIAALADNFSQIAADLILVPLGLGHHVDHILTREAACQAFGLESLLFYEDLPYACRQSEADRTSAAKSACKGLLQMWMLNARSAPGTKQKYASCYPSQIAPEVSNEMEMYARELNGRERFYGTDDARKTVAGIFAERAPHA